MVVTVGSICTGVGALELGLEDALGPIETLWHCENDPHASKVLEQRYPTVPNLGDITVIDWTRVPRPKLLAGGTPCQDLSHAGKRGGMHAGTRSNLWVSMRDAVAVLRPSYVVWENVRGAYTACADSEMGRCPRCMGADPDGPHVPYLRALGRVLGDLSALGYDCRWGLVRASDAGAPHGRARLFIVAADTGGERHGSGQDTGRVGWLAGEDAVAARERERPRPVIGDRSVEAGGWGVYEPVVRRWERILDRPAPRPVERNELSPRFVEWMQGLPAGWVTDIEGIPRNQQLKMFGNMCVPQQASLAVRVLLQPARSARLVRPKEVTMTDTEKARKPRATPLEKAQAELKRADDKLTKAAAKLDAANAAREAAKQEYDSAKWGRDHFASHPLLAQQPSAVAATPVQPDTQSATIARNLGALPSDEAPPAPVATGDSWATG